MPLRDLNEDREVRAKALLLGHIRLGTFNGRHPEQSDTFVFTSADNSRLKPLQVDFGGTIERYEPQGAGEEPWRLQSDTDAFTALFPFADSEGNLSQSWELWTRAGIKRRCDGFDCTLVDVDEISGEITETATPCICAATEDRECSPTSRLRLLLPQTGLGLWEMTTNSRVAATHLHDQIRFISEVAAGRMNRLPVRVVYAPRQISYFDEKDRKRRTTTKRIVSLSIAGDAGRALAPMGMEPDKALLAAVREVLQDTGRVIELPAGEGPTAHALPAHSPAPVATDDPHQDRATHQGTESGETPEVAASPDAGEPASPELWERAKKHIGASSRVLSKARKAFPDANLTSASQITQGQLQELLAAELKAS